MYMRLKRLAVLLFILLILPASSCADTSGKSEGSGAASAEKPSPSLSSSETATFPSLSDVSAEPSASLSLPTTEISPDENAPADVSSLLGQYGWTVTDCLGVSDDTMPESLMTNVEDPPTQFYWMQAVVLSKDIGYDLLAYLSEPIKIEVYSVIGELPEKYTHPAMTNTRGIVFRSGTGVVIGAHIDSGRHAGSSYSLDRRDMDDLGLPLLTYWARNYYDPNDPVNIAAENRTAEQVIRRYFEGVASADAATQLSSLSLSRKLSSLYVNLDTHYPYNNPQELYSYLTGVEVLSVKAFTSVQQPGITMYEVCIDATLTDDAKSILGSDGKMGRFVQVGLEHGSLRVFGDGTGP